MQHSTTDSTSPTLPTPALCLSRTFSVPHHMSLSLSSINVTFFFLSAPSVLTGSGYNCVKHKTLSSIISEVAHSPVSSHKIKMGPIPCSYCVLLINALYFNKKKSQSLVKSHSQVSLIFIAHLTISSFSSSNFIFNSEICAVTGRKTHCGSPFMLTSS